MHTAEKGRERVRAYLHDLYDADPSPLRSYLTQEEAKFLTNNQSIGHIMFKDLDIRGYGSRHRTGVETAIASGLNPNSWDFWHLARLTFLELGGCYQEGFSPPK